MLTIYNTKTRKKEAFVPLREGRVSMYACGPTVYDFFHIGNARAFTVFDTVRRYLAYRGYQVTMVQNFTDIDDKMIRRANAEGITVQDLAERFIAEYKTDAAALGIAPADIHPRATHHIPEMIALIERLLDKGVAYVAEDGVYFSVEDYPAYGQLSGRNLSDMEAGARIDVDEKKKNPMDFALWKMEKPGEPAWDAPWGRGRPGWHIECSAMSMKYLGETIDIHTGATDLIFPHHENEMAQSEAATGCTFVRYWVHNGFINIDNVKMSKSEGNFFTVRDIVGQYNPEAVRLFLLSAHYRSPINFTRELVQSATAALQRLHNARDTYQSLAASAPERPLSPADEAFMAALPKAREAFVTAMDDDFNTADALGAVYEFVREANRYLPAAPKACAKAALALLGELCSVLGLFYRQQSDIPQEVLDMAEARQLARKARDFAEADRLRAAIAAAGFALEDTPQGPKLKKA